MMQTRLSRKLFAPGSAVRAAPSIAGAFRECRVTGYANEVEKVTFSTEEQFRTRILNLTQVASFDDVLCGRLLHADCDRYLRTQALAPREQQITAYLGSGPVHTGVDMALHNIEVCLANG